MLEREDRSKTDGKRILKTEGVPKIRTRYGDLAACTAHDMWAGTRFMIHGLYALEVTRSDERGSTQQP